MKIIKIISENKKTKRSSKGEGLYKSKVGYSMCIVEENGELKTKHMVKSL